MCDPRNAGRNDLGCPFGCCEARRKESSSERSVAYYQTDEGKGKKKVQNNKRKATAESNPQLSSEPESLIPNIVSPAYKPELVKHLCILTSLIEGRRVSQKEIIEMLVRVLRQHSMEKRNRVGQIVAWLNKQSP